MRHFFVLSILCMAAPALAQRSYTYRSVPGDLTDTRIYTLENGCRCG
jgi:hypothetical protein